MRDLGSFVAERTFRMPQRIPRDISRSVPQPLPLRFVLNVADMARREPEKNEK